MTTLKVYKLRFISPLHISDNRDDYSVSVRNISSDTMYASLTACLAKLGETIPADGDIGFAISSLFPYYQKNEDSDPIFFLPAPLRTKHLNLKDPSIAKKIKKVAWVDSKFYSELLQGNDLIGNEDNYKFVKDVFFTDEDINTDFICADLMQRACMPARNGHEDTVPYFMERLSFRDCAGFYFIVIGDTENLDKAIALLSKEGIGTDRHVGNGFFEYSNDEITLDLPEEAAHVISLSMYLPEDEDTLKEMLDSDYVAYNIVRRGGWITTYPYGSFRKNVVYMITEGSILNSVSNDVSVKGRIVDLGPRDIVTHPIWRCGKSIMLPVKCN